ncbi:MAG: M15 family metallopeptidase [Gammaproteobacteria bacterium]|nr:M15 family metallopeptidase [Gammaproteobacteria bacterium]MBT8149769.1 M15 family metallopeptidase [Gammaproteobacteria bacterium]NNL10909.1 M15 family metallopeptidase [Pseudomonadales bacterium]NNM12089.1 M15 family metallopeptidase [Pseudomonadales bacterium]RZV56154.1 MAG: D-alanyl-D-alanine carboxypeptidase family protein [Pseudomonadales bacterium]
MNDNNVEFACMTGRDARELVPVNGQCIHRCVRPDWMALRRSAADAGFDLVAISAYRSFERQLRIWNEKARAERAVLNDAGEALDISALAPRDQLHAILRFSALPGASRHHWGTDVDVIDASATPDNYQVQLVEAECCANGPFAPLHAWLDERINSHRAYGFYRPYIAQKVYGEGIAAEPWHLSHRPVAQRFEILCSYQNMLAFYSALQDLELKTVLLENFEQIYRDYICADSSAQNPVSV